MAACTAVIDEDTGTVRQALEQSSYTSEQDATIAAAAPLTNYGSDTNCIVDGGSTERSCLLRWNLKSIPPGSEVIAATITLQVTNGSSEDFGVYFLYRSWHERWATWNIAHFRSKWELPGAFGPTDRASIGGAVVSGGLGSRAFEVNTAGLQHIQYWVNNPLANYGVIISGSSSDGMTFASSEHAAETWRPRLTVVYIEGSASVTSTIGTTTTSPTGAGGSSAGG